MYKKTDTHRQLRHTPTDSRENVLTAERPLFYFSQQLITSNWA